MKQSGRPARLTAAQAAELVRRWTLFQQNKPGRLSREYGLSVGALYGYVKGRRKKFREAT